MFLILRMRSLKRNRARRLEKATPSRIRKTITVPAHAYVVGAGGIVRAGASSIQSSIGSWVKKLANACFVAAMIATGILLFTHFTQKWTASGYPAIPLSALNLDGTTDDDKRKRSVPLQAAGHQRQRVHTSAQPSNFAQYEG